MGDLIMTSPAIRAVKEALDCRITVLTSQMASEVCPLIPEIDEVIIATLPWIKAGTTIKSPEFNSLTQQLNQKNFDAAIIFTVYSQSALPSAMMAWIAGIPNRIAYSRENPYDLLTFWVPDNEPFETIYHQVERDLRLIESVGIPTTESSIKLSIPDVAFKSMEVKLLNLFDNHFSASEIKFRLKNHYDLSIKNSHQSIASGIEELILIHVGVSELKRAYPTERWIDIAKGVIERFDSKVIFTGSLNERELTDHLQAKTGNKSISAAGIFTVEEFAALINRSRLLISVNTAPVHMAAGLQKPVIVLYAQTNPQHKPWKTQNRVFEFPVPESLQSKNGVIRFVNRKFYNSPVDYPEPSEVIDAVHSLLDQTVDNSASQ